MISYGVRCASSNWPPIYSDAHRRALNRIVGRGYDPPLRIDEAQGENGRQMAHASQRRKIPMTEIGLANPNGKDAAAITEIEYSGLQVAFDFFNAELFGGQLPDPFITYQRRSRTRGYYSHERFAERAADALRNEIALNPDTFTGRTDREVASTLVHEMCHSWQYAFGKPSRRGYHNREWAQKMKEVGLYPSSTGDVGGCETGQRVSHYIIAGAAFDRAFDRLAARGWKLNLQSAPKANPAKPPDGRLKFTCPGCDDSFRGKHDLVPICARCTRFFVPTGSTEEEMEEVAKRARAERAAMGELSALMISDGLASTIQ
jgi:hypothetical protein